MTDPAIIAASYAAERNYSHNLDDVIDPSGAVGAWGTAKESTTKLVDLSDNGNIADIHGAMPTEGFIQGRRFTAANSNYLDCGNDSSLDITDTITISTWIKQGSGGGTAGSTRTINLGTNNHKIDFKTGNDRNFIFVVSHTDNSETYGTISDGVPIGKLTHLVGTFKNGQFRMYKNGVKLIDKVPTSTGIESIPEGYLTIGCEGMFDGSIYYVDIHNHVKSETKTKQSFNTFARLPFWSVNYTDYPDNVAEYTDNLPYSSSIISSGTFKVDDDKLQCVSAGTITYSASYEFDGSEYIKVEIDGVEYAGTGTITQGNTTVSVAQGSNKVTIAMGTGDAIEGEIGIQFREEV